MKWSFERRLLLLFLLIFAGIAIAGIVTYSNNLAYRDTNRLVKHAQDILFETEQLLSTTKEFESGSRGYIITGDSAYLEHYTIAQDVIYPHLEQLRRLVQDNQAQLARVNFLGKILELGIGFSERTLILRNQKGLKAAQDLLDTRQGKLYMGQIRKTISEIQQEENDLLVQREKANERNRTSFNRAFYALFIAIAALLIIVFLVVRKNFSRLRKAQAQNRESEEQIQTIFKAAPDAVVTIDDEGRIMKWNRKAEAIFGWTAEEATGKLLSETIIPHRYRQAHEQGLAHFLKTGEGPVLNKTIEIQAMRRDLEELDVALSISPTLIDGKHIFIGFIRDITEKKKSEEEIQRTNQFLDTILENIPNMIFVKDASELRFVRFNKAGEELLGYSRKDLMGKNDYDFFPKDQADFFTAKDRDVLSNGKLVDIAEEPIETTHGQKWLHTRKIPILGDDGAGTYLLGISEDITERKRQDELLRESNEQFLKLFYSNPTAMCINTVEEGRFMDVNESFEKLVGFKKVELVGKTSIEVGIIDRQSRATVVSNVRQTGAARNVEQVVKNRTGARISVLLSVEKIRLKNSECLLSAIIDITERKQAEEKIQNLNEDLEKTVSQLQAVNKELESFTYSVSHDLRSPLRIIDGYAGILAQDYKNALGDEGKRTLDVIMSNTQRMGQLIDDLLNLSRIGKRDLNIQRVEMDVLVKTVMDEQLGMMPEQKVEVKIHSLDPAACDSGTIRQVWTNLIANALKYSRNKEKSKIEIGSYKEADKVVYYVKDNGVGFDMQYADKLFGIFQRLHRMDEFEGTGVGLAIVQRIVTKHGGKVWADAAVDKGATFYFSLPAVDELIS